MGAHAGGAGRRAGRRGAWPALGLTLVASVRRRRRDFALLKTLGFTRRQLAGAVAWQSSVIVVIGLVDRRAAGHRGGPLALAGLRRPAVGRTRPVVPVGSIALAGLAALLLANLVAALPGRGMLRERRRLKS